VSMGNFQNNNQVMYMVVKLACFCWHANKSLTIDCVNLRGLGRMPNQIFIEIMEFFLF
jgi:hypothetical protein